MRAAPSRRPWIALALAATLGACAQSGTNRTGENIVWETDRVVPSSGQSTSTAPADSRSGSSAAATGTGIDPCREYTQTVTIGGKEEKAYGRVCPQPDGSWRVDTPAGETPRPPMPVAKPQAYPVYPYPVSGSVFFGSGYYFSDRHHRHRHRHFPRYR